ncbi:zinc finger protein ZAT4-like [Canna indica]|uniref:Zinc finger protein ZAT4-like n=1 Tax=Canna indica TaxID=4628 RepID=A0AAQ3KHM0_9LILI|nr:zinc finger protein ZAT4-like [Canna indica]
MAVATLALIAVAAAQIDGHFACVVSGPDEMRSSLDALSAEAGGVVELVSATPLISRISMKRDREMWDLINVYPESPKKYSCSWELKGIAYMDRYTCHLCFRRFPNGRALGGHMRSHFVPVAPPHLSGGSSASASSDVQPEMEEEVVEEAKEMGTCYGLRSNPRKSFRLVDPQFSSSFPAAEPAGSCVVVQDWESDIESPRAHRRRAKQPRRHAASQPEAEPVSSVSDATTEEDVALSLMMLSRNSWTAGEVNRPSYYSNDEEENEVVARRPAVRSHTPPPPRRGRTRYQCGVCKKVFRSYQALGGHRAGHKKAHGCVPTVEPQIYSEADSADAKVHECPFCFRVFSSGQALGGHKRSHLTSSVITTIDNSPVSRPRPPCPPPSISPVTGSSTKYVNSIGHIDLNLPAATDDDFELLAVSYMDFIANPTS